MSAFRRGFSLEKRERVVVAGRQTKKSRPGFVPIEQPSTLDRGWKNRKQKLSLTRRGRVSVDSI